jgi:hypothetical protein
MSYAVPGLLLPRSSEDPIARTVNQSMSAGQIFSEFKSAVTKEPQNLREIVVPYVCLAALSLRDDISPLRATTALAVRPEYKWMDYVRQVLVESYQPTSRLVHRVPQPVRSTVSIESTSSTSTSILRAS